MESAPKGLKYTRFTGGKSASPLKKETEENRENTVDKERHKKEDYLLGSKEDESGKIKKERAEQEARVFIGTQISKNILISGATRKRNTIPAEGKPMHVGGRRLKEEKPGMWKKIKKETLRSTAPGKSDLHTPPGRARGQAVEEKIRGGVEGEEHDSNRMKGTVLKESTEEGELH